MSSDPNLTQNIQEKFAQAKELQSQGNIAEAVAEYRAILEADNRNLAALHQMGQLSEQQEEFAVAIEHYRRAIELDPNPPFWVYRHFGFALSQQEQFLEAISAYQKAIAANPEDVSTYGLLGQTQGRIGDIDGAISSYQKQIELSSDLPVWVYLNLGDGLSQQERWEEAIEVYEKVLELEPENAGIQRLLAAVTARKEAIAIDPVAVAKRLQGEGKLEEALFEYRSVLEKDGRNRVALHQVAQICEGLGKWEEAVEGYRKAIEVDAESPFWVYRHLGFALSQVGDLEGASEAYQRSIKLNPEDESVYCLLGQNLEQQGYIDQAIDAYQKSIEINPDFHWAYYSLGDFLVSQDRYEEAVYAYRQAVKIQPDLPGLIQKLQEILPKISSKNQDAPQNNENLVQIKATEIIPLMNRFFDEKWYFETYPEVVSSIIMGYAINGFDYYIRFGTQKQHSPNSAFDEEWYLAYNQDVKLAVESGQLSSGFEHFLITGRYEGRLAKPDLYSTLKQKYPSIIEPVGINNLQALEFKLKPLPAQVKSISKTINILVPTLDADIVFGGYISLLHFIRRIIEESFDVRLIICDDQECNLELFKISLKSKSKILNAINKCTIINATSKEKVIEISPDDRFIAYDAWTSILAHNLAVLTNFKKHFFFIQEYETIFCHNCSISALMDGAYRLPHIAIFNTQILASYFKNEELGVFSGKMENDFIIFEHSLGKLSPPQLTEMQQKKGKSLIFYARPEAHAARNLFEIGILGLRRAVERGIFDNSWIFNGIGTLGASYQISLGKGLEIDIFSKIPQNDYENILRSYDIGLSLMYAPHPSILPFEMAKAGLIVVTNVYKNRDSDRLRSISNNLVPCDPDVESIASSLELAVFKAEDFQSRIQNAKIDWIDDWDMTFGKVFFEKLRSYLW